MNPQEKLDKFVSLTIEHNAVDDYAKGITDEEYAEMKKLEKEIISNQEIVNRFRKGYEDSIDALSLADNYRSIYQFIQDTEEGERI